MRLFQNSGVYPGYMPRLNTLSVGCKTFSQRRDVFLSDRYSACHILQPVLQADADAFFTNGDDTTLQRLWARENGMRADASLETILLAQIEQHRAEVFYNIDPMRYGNAFIRRLPRCVKYKVAWRAAPSGGMNFSAYDRVVCNFPGILRSYEASQCRTSYFTPAHDPLMDRYAANTERPVDVLFVGGYSRHHRKRAEVLEAVAACSPQVKVKFHLDRSRLTRLAESKVGWLLPLKNHRRPPFIANVSADAVFGLDLYAALSHAKIVLNGAIDMSGVDRGNMRCWESMGCGALMLSDEGLYPSGIVAGRDFETYRDADDAVAKIKSILANPVALQSVAAQGRSAISNTYSKSAQWDAFVQIIDCI